MVWAGNTCSRVGVLRTHRRGGRRRRRGRQLTTWLTKRTALPVAWPRRTRIMHDAFIMMIRATLCNTITSYVSKIYRRRATIARRRSRRVLRHSRHRAPPRNDRTMCTVDPGSILAASIVSVSFLRRRGEQRRGRDRGDKSEPRHSCVRATAHARRARGSLDAQLLAAGDEADLLHVDALLLLQRLLDLQDLRRERDDGKELHAVARPLNPQATRGAPSTRDQPRKLGARTVLVGSKSKACLRPVRVLTNSCARAVRSGWRVVAPPAAQQWRRRHRHVQHQPPTSTR